MAILTSADDSVVKKRIVLSKEPVIIGRHPECDLIIDDASVSRHHAQIVNEQGNFYVQDLNSRNGTFVNDTQIQEAAKLFDGSEIRICDAHFIFHLTNPVVAARSGRQTIEAPSGTNFFSSVVMDDDDVQTSEENSQIMSQLEVPSHYDSGPGKVKPEQKLQALIKIAHALSEDVERNEILDGILDCLFELFIEADRGFIVLKSPDGALVPQGVKTRRPSQDEQIRISSTIARRVMETKRPIISSDAAADSRFDMSQSIADFRIRSIMCAPLINSKDESIGIIQLDTLRRSIAFDEEDLEILVTVGMQASLAIQKADLFENSKRNREIENDLKLAHELQLRFLPQRGPELDGYDFYSFYKPMQQVGGDYYDYVDLGDGRLAVIVADVVGHGITAALMMAKVSAESRFALATCDSPVDAIKKMNSSLSDMNIDRFVTLVLGLVDTKTNKVSIVNAGHMPPILRRGDLSEVKLVAAEESGLPLGVLEEAEYQVVDCELGEGDTLIMYTDGINESMDVDGNQLTTGRMLEEIKSGQPKTPEATGELLIDALKRHVGAEPTIDDICMVCFGRKP